MRKCEWCNHVGDDVMVLIEVWPNHHVGQARHVCKRHLIPGDDICPIKPYFYEEDDEIIKRIWVPKEKLGPILLERHDWFKAHEEELAKYSWRNYLSDEKLPSTELPNISQLTKNRIREFTE